ncbi:MAG TPA: extracellular solute-binding protein [Thermoleophilia bacterium]|nr:extracellular solute-binding protein [Thermoleophilia bacterium]
MTSLSGKAKRHLVAAVVLLAVAAFGIVGASFAFGADKAVPNASPDYTKLLLETTTSVRDSGVLDKVVIPDFEKRYPGITVSYVAVGSGAALAAAAAGNCDAVIVHSPDAEKTLLASGGLTMRLPFAYNYFIIVGPKGDPAHVSQTKSAVAAFKAIAAYGKKLVKVHSKRVLFISRGDNSGTNAKELQLWAAAGVTINPASLPSWYQETGSGMAATLQVANQKNAYTLTDVATWLNVKSTLPSLFVRLTARKDLLNQYSIDLCNQAQHNSVNSTGAELLAEWLVSAGGQRALAAYHIKGRQVYYPNSYKISVTNLPPAPAPGAAP